MKKWCYTLFILSLTSGCVFIPQGREYASPQERPAFLNDYYSRGSSFHSYTVQSEEQKRYGTRMRIVVDSDFGPITLDYFKRKEISNDLILVFPVLGGRNLFSTYFAKAFAEKGYDTAVVHRSSEFKDPNNIDRLEELFRENISRDRVVLDFFENIYGKRDFGSFGISRGAINAALLAGVDERLQFNVFGMGGSELVNLFRYSEEHGMEKYRNRAMAAKNFTEEELFEYLDKTVYTDPKQVARYIDAKKTLMFLAMFDTSVPVRYGLRLRKQIGRPTTIMLPTGHYTSVAFTHFVPLTPIDYVESESLAFYDKSFGRSSVNLKMIPIRLLQIPFEVIIRTFDRFI